MGAARRGVGQRTTRAATVGLAQPNRSRDAVVHQPPKNLLALVGPRQAPQPLKERLKRFKGSRRRGRQRRRLEVHVSGRFAITVKASRHLKEFVPLPPPKGSALRRDEKLRAGTNRER